MKTALPAILFVLLACAAGGASAAPGQARVIVDCSATHDGCVRKTVPPAPPAKAVLPPDQAGNAEMSMMGGAMVMAPPSLAAPSMPPSVPVAAPSSATATPSIPDAAHSACAGRKAGSRMTVKLGPNDTMTGVCRKESGKMRFRMRQYRSVG